MFLHMSSQAEPEIPNELPLFGDVRLKHDLPLLVYCRLLFQSMCHTYRTPRPYSPQPLWLPRGFTLPLVS